MTVGFLGFGEAASSMAAGLYEEGIQRIICYDSMQDNPELREKFEKRVISCNASMLESASDVCKESDIVFSAVPANCAVSAAESAESGMHKGLIYVDVSTAAPNEKINIAAAVNGRRADFVDAAMMGALITERHRVPMLLCGSGARKMINMMKPYHMRLEFLDGPPGTATSVKFIRSIAVKGLSCLLIESLQAARCFGVEKILVDSLIDSFGDSFINTINNLTAGAVIHAARQEHELQNVVDFLKSEGLSYTMAEATHQKLAWLNEIDIKNKFTNGVPREWEKLFNRKVSRLL